MLKKHLSILMLLVIGTFAFGQSIPSGTARYEALGNSPFILDAATDISMNPAWTNYYRNYGFGDIGNGYVTGSDFDLTGQYAGVTMGVGSKLNLGMIVNKRRDLWNTFGIPGGGINGNQLSNNAPVVPVTLLIGYSANKDFHIGLAPYFAMYSANTIDTITTVAPGTLDISNNSIGADLGILYMIKKGWFEFDVKFGLNSYEYKTVGGDPVVTNTWDNDGGMELSAFVRGWIYPKKSSKLAVVPFLNFSTFSFQPTFSDNTTATNGLNFSFMNFGGGVGLNLPIMDDIQVAGGLTAGYSSFTADSGAVEYKRSVFVAPGFKLAAETRIADWLTGRIGFSKGVERISESGTPNLAYFYPESQPLVENNFTGSTSSEQTLSLGAGFHFGRFSIDATVSEKWLKEGINFVSGGDTDLFGVISASYNFNEK